MPAQRPHPYQPKTHKVERWYGQQLRKIARHVGDIIGAFPAGDPASDPVIARAMRDYSDLLGDWAAQTSMRMLDGVRREDDAAWRVRAMQMRASLRDEILNAPTGDLMRALLDEQIALIKSIPIEAATRVHHWTMIGIENSTRAAEVAEAIRNSTSVTQSRAMLIARTEVSRTASRLTESRARYVGSEGYTWRTVGDADVRPSHRAMNGKFVYWDAPPTLDKLTGHAGCVPNCRCFPDVSIPE